MMMKVERRQLVDVERYGNKILVIGGTLDTVRRAHRFRRSTTTNGVIVAWLLLGLGVIGTGFGVSDSILVVRAVLLLLVALAFVALTIVTVLLNRTRNLAKDEQAAVHMECRDRLLVERNRNMDVVETLTARNRNLQREMDRILHESAEVRRSLSELRGMNSALRNENSALKNNLVGEPGGIDGARYLSSELGDDTDYVPKIVDLTNTTAEIVLDSIPLRVR